QDGKDGSKQTQDNWYDYDAMNRFTVTMGSHDAQGNLVLGSRGVRVEYDRFGRRVKASNGSDGTVETYSYTADGYLTETQINGTRAFLRGNDLQGRVLDYQSYDWKGDGSTKASIAHTDYDVDNKITRQVVDGATTDYKLLADGTTDVTTQVSQGTTVTTYYGYEWWDDAKQSTITAQPYNENAPGWQPGISHLSYDVNGHLKEAVDERGHRSLRYVNDAQGVVIRREEVDHASLFKKQDYYYVDGRQVGAVGNDGPSRVDFAQALAQGKLGNNKDQYRFGKAVSSADFDQNYEPIGPNYPAQAPGSVTVRAGDTLQSLAASLWGDRSLWYLLADANGLKDDAKLDAGQVLQVPNKVTNFHNNSGTYRVYSPGEAVGDVTPTLPDPPPPPPPPDGDDGCGGIGMVFVAVVAVVATVFTAGAALAVMGPALAATTGGMMLAGAVGAAVGSIASQGMAMAMGMQSKFSWSQVGMAAIGGAVTGGMSTGAFGSALQNSNVAVQAMASSVITQGVAMATGLQKSFNWTSVAASGVAAWAGSASGLQAGKGANPFERIGYGAMRGMIGGTIQSVLGEDHRPNWGELAASSFGNAVGDQVTGSIQAAEQERLARAGREVDAIQGMYGQTQKSMLEGLMSLGRSPDEGGSRESQTDTRSMDGEGSASDRNNDGAEPNAANDMAQTLASMIQEQKQASPPKLNYRTMTAEANATTQNDVALSGSFGGDRLVVMAGDRDSSVPIQRGADPYEEKFEEAFNAAGKQYQASRSNAQSTVEDIMGQPLNGRSNYTLSLGWSKVVSGEVGILDFLTYQTPDAKARIQEENAHWAPSPFEQRMDMLSSSPMASLAYFGAVAVNASPSAQDTAITLGYYGGNTLASLASVGADATQYGLVGASRPQSGVALSQENSLSVSRSDPYEILRSVPNAGVSSLAADSVGAADWVRPRGWRLPATNGQWSGIPGNSSWTSFNDSVNAVTGGQPIPFKNGYPNFSQWSQGTFTFDNLTGTNADFGLVYDAVAKEYGLANRTAGQNLLRDLGLSPHHVEDGLNIELVPTDLHGNVPHIGGAANLRKGG
ncbi:LysM peptidoglycan-binding domain-containing protein, partial [Chromobacterium alticapitis]